MYPSPAAKVNSFTGVGKKFISLHCCSILKVYSGVSGCTGPAVTKATAQKPRATLITHDIFWFLSIYVTSF
jgi:hypothetical protein